MNVVDLQDKLARAMGIAARKVGTPTIVYRPDGPLHPVSTPRRIIEISAAFEAGKQSLNSKGVVPTVWHGIFDTLYTRQADYLVNSLNTFFVASQAPGHPTLCVLTNRVVSLSRATSPVQGGYSGLYEADTYVLLAGWPASFAEAGASSSAQRPVARVSGKWTVMLPTLPVTLQVADTITDDLGGTYAVDAAEQNLLGWRLLVRQTGA